MVVKCAIFLHILVNQKYKLEYQISTGMKTFNWRKKVFNRKNVDKLTGYILTRLIIFSIGTDGYKTGCRWKNQDAVVWETGIIHTQNDLLISKERKYPWGSDYNEKFTKILSVVSTV